MRPLVSCHRNIIWSISNDQGPATWDSNQSSVPQSAIIVQLSTLQVDRGTYIAQRSQNHFRQVQNPSVREGLLPNVGQLHRGSQGFQAVRDPVDHAEDFRSRIRPSRNRFDCHRFGQGGDVLGLVGIDVAAWMKKNSILIWLSTLLDLMQMMKPTWRGFSKPKAGQLRWPLFYHYSFPSDNGRNK